MGSLLSKRFVYNPQTGKMDEIPHARRQWGQLVVGDLEDFVSPVDGTVVHGRAGLREHDKRNGVTNTADFTKQWERQAAERARHFEGRQNDRSRLENTIRAYNDLSEGRAKRRT